MEPFYKLTPGTLQSFSWTSYGEILYIPGIGQGRHEYDKWEVWFWILKIKTAAATIRLTFHLMFHANQAIAPVGTLLTKNSVQIIWD